MICSDGRRAAVYRRALDVGRSRALTGALCRDPSRIAPLSGQSAQIV